MTTLRPLKTFSMDLAQRIGLMRLLQSLASTRPDRLYVLAYHRVDHFDHRPWLDPGLISATPEQFEAHMALLARHYRPVTLPQVLAALDGGPPLPPQAVLVTVDDGYRDFAETIFPTASQYGICPVLFVPTAQAEKSHFWWDRLHQAIHFSQADELTTLAGRFPLKMPDDKRRTLRSLKQHFKQLSSDETLAEVDRLYAELASPIPHPERSTLNWDELRSLAQAGVAIASHTHTHPILSRVSLERAMAEIRTSQQMVQREIGAALPVFAFPDGKPQAFTPALVDFLRAEGFKLVFTMVEGCARLASHDPLRLPRLGVWSNLTLAQFHWHLTPAYRKKEKTTETQRAQSF